MNQQQFKTIPVSKLQQNFQGTLKDAASNNYLLTITNWYRPTHILIPVGCITEELKSLLPSQILSSDSLALSKETGQ